MPAALAAAAAVGATAALDPGCGVSAGVWCDDRDDNRDHFPGNPHKVKDAAACCALCDAAETCYPWTFHPGSGECYLKRFCWRLVANASAQSGGDGVAPLPSPTPPPVPPPPGPPGWSLPMKNAAQPGMRFPITGLGTRGAGYKMGGTAECWHYPQCCTKDYCPSVNATRDFLRLAASRGGVARIETGYPYGDAQHAGEQCRKENTTATVGSGVGGHAFCDVHGIRNGIKESGVKREDVFITIKVGTAGPMAAEDSQVLSGLHDLDITYADLCLMHLPEIGPDTGSHGEYSPDHCVPDDAGGGINNEGYDARLCRIGTWKSLLWNWKQGRCRAVGVTSWNASNLRELEDAGLELPSVVQYKFHVHQSTASGIQRDLVDYCKEKGIILNGFAPLGEPDWVEFDGDGMTKTPLEEPVVQAIAARTGKTPAQVMLRWVAQQGIATQPRTVSVAHMKENLDIFDWELAAEDMAALSGMPQCNTTRGNPYSPDDPNYGRHGNVVGITKHC